MRELGEIGVRVTTGHRALRGLRCLGLELGRCTDLPLQICARELPSPGLRTLVHEARAELDLVASEVHGSATARGQFLSLFTLRLVLDDDEHRVEIGIAIQDRFLEEQLPPFVVDAVIEESRHRARFHYPLGVEPVARFDTQLFTADDKWHAREPVQARRAIAT